MNLGYKIRHALAVWLEIFRRPGRFSVYSYSRSDAMKRLETSGQGKVLDLGCGGRRLAKHVITVDLRANACTDIIADANRLPFTNGAFEGVWMDALLEHVPNAGSLLGEVSRVLKPGGWVYAEVPFLQGYHAAPGDYTRWTTDGLRQLFKDWQVEWISMASGPFSALAYQLRNCFSILTSFGSDSLYRFLFEAVWGYVVWPLKFFDVFVRQNPRAMGHAFGYGVMARKRN